MLPFVGGLIAFPYLCSVLPNAYTHAFCAAYAVGSKALNTPHSDDTPLDKKRAVIRNIPMITKQHSR